MAKQWTKDEWNAAREKLGLDNPFRKVPIRSRVDYENAMVILDTIRANFAERFAKGERVDKMGIDRKLDEAERIFKGKLLSMRLRMLDSEIERKNTLEVRNTDEGLERKAAGEWIPTTEAEVGRLSATTDRTVRVKRGQFQRNTELERPSRPASRMVSREEGRRLAARGEIVRWNEGSCEVIG